ncbi:hypothetical protein MNBD_NITROSPINAE01-1457 [hydrothermal vent metagenome]|uniref:Peptidase M48 domain-containing protein n=1 Tax=hydrothermal vent metagenome TaxID=652676 RepID=A0A3B1BEJ3_9ZZZZ
MPARFLVVVLVFLVAFSANSVPAMAEQNKKSAEEEKGKGPSDLERGLMIFQSVIKTHKASRRLSWKEEQKLGRAVAEQVFLRYGPRSRNEKINKYVTLVGKTVAAQVGKREADYKFAVINNREPNAFAAPGGFVFITTGLLKSLSSEAQLAGVLAHEVAHVSKGHMVNAIQRARKLEGMAELSAMLMNKNRNEFSQVVGEITDILFTRGLDKEKEFEADRVGVEYANQSGYDGRGLYEFLVSLKKKEGRERSIFFSTHPPTYDRIKKLKRGALQNIKNGQKLEKRFVAMAR